MMRARRRRVKDEASQTPELETSIRCNRVVRRRTASFWLRSASDSGWVTPVSRMRGDGARRGSTGIEDSAPSSRGSNSSRPVCPNGKWRTDPRLGARPQARSVLRRGYAFPRREPLPAVTLPFAQALHHVPPEGRNRRGLAPIDRQHRRIPTNHLERQVHPFATLHPTPVDRAGKDLVQPFLDLLGDQIQLRIPQAKRDGGTFVAMMPVKEGEVAP